MMSDLRLARFATILAMAAFAVFAGIGAAQAIDAATATHVGGDLTDLGKKLAALQESGAKVLAAAPGAYGELGSALGRIAEARGERAFATNAWLVALSVAFLALVVFVVRLAASRMRRACVADPVLARGAAGLLGLELADRIAVGVVSYVLIELWSATGGNQELLAVALLWAAVRWWIFMLPIEALLRPGLPAFRLIAMSDAAARQIKIIVAVTLLIGLTGISVMPLLLRARLPLPSGQVIALAQGLVVTAGCALGLWRYAASRSAPPRSARLWLAFGVTAIAVLWLAWTIAVLLLEFSVFHSLALSMRIAVLAYVVHTLLGLSAGAGWVLFAQRSISAAAILAIAILLAQVWLVDELALVAPATWVSVRRSLVTAALTLFVGYVAWRYLYHWTEERLRAAAPGLAPDSDEQGAHPASRLTTVLPMLRILIGIAILVVAGLLALSQLGFEITPLLAGAGVFGLAVSFGSQALVRDIVSGIFFMADDAFRVGEYIDTGRLKGNVELISLRSVRLRHQNGQIHTIPFGQLTSITNFSRDWQTVKFNLRLARDTDLEKLRKTVKRIGQDMLKEPELGKEFLQPLKLQGVAEIADSALVVRLKFTARPFKPSWVQRESLKRIYKVFGEQGIEFASNAITVQSAGPGGTSPELSAGAAGAAQRGARPGAADNPA